MADMMKKVDGLYKELILTHGAGLDENGGVTVHGKDRINKSVNLYEDGYSPRILMCGEISSKKMKEYAVRQYGISEDSILTENLSRYTIQELVNARNIFLKPNDWKSLYLVSNYWHGPRINMLAKELLKRYDWLFEGAVDSRPDEEKNKDISAEKIKMLKNKALLKTFHRKDIE